MSAIAAIAVAVLMLSAADVRGETSSERMLKRLRALAGEWQGSAEWSDGRASAQPLRATYSVTGNVAVVESLIMGETPAMTSVYHLDGSDLRMTHFCVANQPRLKASRIDETTGRIEFSFVDATNLASPESGRVEAAEIHLIDNDHVVVKFTFRGGAGTAVETITLLRVRAGS